MVEVMRVESGKFKVESVAAHQKTRGRILLFIALATLSTFNFQLSTAQRRVIAGLEEHAEYRELIAREGALVRTSDSLASLIASFRGRLRTDTLSRASLSADIVRMEEEGFGLRGEMARLASRINTIEQEWILANLSAPRPAPPSDGPSGDGPAPIESFLTPEQSAELNAARRAEAAIPGLMDEYRRVHALAGSLARAYDAATTQPEADSLLALFEERRTAGEHLAARIGSEWGAIFDSKSYIYNLLADKQNRRDMLTLFESGMEELRNARGEIPLLPGMGGDPDASDGVAPPPAPLIDYVLQKRMLTGYELALAGEQGDTASADSLRAVLSTLPGPASLAGLGPVTIREKLFLDYADIVTGGAGPYNASNPIPDVALWPRGIIWRVQVGNYTTRQSPSVFRGARPLAVFRGDDGRFRYLAGGFPTDSLATAAAERMRRAGFRAPAPVVWMDGVYLDPAGTEKIYRIEISGTDDLPALAREAIAETGTVDMVRGAGGFIIAPLDAPAAIRLRTALEQLRHDHPQLTAELSKIPE